MLDADADADFLLFFYFAVSNSFVLKMAGRYDLWRISWGGNGQQRLILLKMIKLRDR